MKYRILSILLAFAIIFSTITVGVKGETDNRATRTIIKDTVYSGTLTEGSTDIYYFTPTRTGMFTVESFGSTDTSVTISGHVEISNAIDSNDDDGTGSNFAIGFYQFSGRTTTIEVRHFDSLFGTGAYTLQVRDQRAQIYTFDYGEDDINTHESSTIPASELRAAGYAVGVHQNKPFTHIDQIIATTFTRFNSEVFFFFGHGEAGHVCFINNSGGYDRLYDNSLYFSSMANTKVAVWTSCKSAVDPDGSGSRRSIAQKSIDSGAQSAIGWNQVTYVPAAKKWTDEFFTQLGNSMYVRDAAASAGSVFLWPWDGSYDGWQVFGEWYTIVDYPDVNPKNSESASTPTQMVDSALLEKLSDTKQYTAYKLKGLGTRYYKTINGHLTNEFYDIHDSGVVKTSSVIFSNSDILNISQQKLAKSTFIPSASISDNGITFNKLIKSEEHIVYMKLNGNVIPIKIIYSNYRNNEGYEYQDVVCINMLDNSYIDYVDICTQQRGEKL